MRLLKKALFVLVVGFALGGCSSLRKPEIATTETMTPTRTGSGVGSADGQGQYKEFFRGPFLMRGNDWVTTARDVWVTIRDVQSDPNYFTYEVAFETESNTIEDSCLYCVTSLHVDLLDATGAVLQSVRYGFSKQCGLRLNRYTSPPQLANKHTITSRIRDAKVYFTYNRNVEWC